MDAFVPIRMTPYSSWRFAAKARHTPVLMVPALFIFPQSHEKRSFAPPASGVPCMRWPQYLFFKQS